VSLLLILFKPKEKGRGLNKKRVGRDGGPMLLLLVLIGILVLGGVIAAVRARSQSVPPTIVAEPNIFDELRRELEAARKTNVESQKAIDYFIHDLDPDHKKKPRRKGGVKDEDIPAPSAKPESSS
jgi:hypothetical protein